MIGALPSRQLRSRVRRLVHAAIARTGVDAVPIRGIRHAIGRRTKLMHALGIDLVIDVGANAGQFGREIRGAGYVGHILSIEPLSDAFAELSAVAERDGNWSAVRCAVGETEGESTLHISANSASSSLLDMLPVHENAAPETRYIGSEQVPVRRLDSLLTEYAPVGVRSYAKIDVQGYELAVLRGAGNKLSDFAAIQLELSLARLYDGAPLGREVDGFVTAEGYALAGVEPGFADPVSGRLLQMDGIYVRTSILADVPGGAPR